MFVQDDLVIYYILFVLPCPVMLGFERELDGASYEHPFTEFQRKNYAEENFVFRNSF